jgi:parvulin-like peptidyl-prolyl isomerase
MRLNETMNSRIGHKRNVLVKQLRSSLFVVFTVCVVSGASTQTLKEPSVVLTAADMSLIVDDLETKVRKKLAQSVEERKAFAKEIRAMLAVAQAAKADGYSDRPELRLRMELTRSFVIAEAYSRMHAQSASAKEVVSQAEIDAFLNEPGTAKDVEAYIDDLRRDGAIVDDARRRQLSDRYARVMIAKRKGIAVGLDRERKIQLDIMLRQAHLLVAAYVRDHAELNKPTDVEVGRYASSHPEVDSRISRAKAEEVLKRALAGEDFSSLARQFSEEESTKLRGGDLRWFGSKTQRSGFG